MRTRFPTTGEVKITGTNNPELIVSVQVDGNWKNLTFKIDDWTVRELSKQILGFHKRIETDAIDRLQSLRQALSYSNSQPEISYRNPNG